MEGRSKSWKIGREEESAETEREEGIAKRGGFMSSCVYDRMVIVYVA